MVKGAGVEKSGGGHRQPVIGAHFVAGDLQLHEAIEGYMSAFNADNEVTILICGRAKRVMLKPMSDSAKRATSSQCRAQRSP